MSDEPTQAPSFSLASLLVGYPGADFTERWAALAHVAPTPLRELVQGAVDTALDDWRSDYLQAFEHGGSPLCENGYGRMRGPGIGVSLAGIAAFYDAFGVRCGGESVDHLAVELEFYAFLLAKEAYLAEVADPEGTDIVRSARERFLAEHLAPLAQAAAARVHDDARFAPLFAFVAALTLDECAKSGLTAAPLESPPRPSDDAPMTCGSAALPIVD